MQEEVEPDLILNHLNKYDKLVDLFQYESWKLKIKKVAWTITVKLTYKTGAKINITTY